MCMFNPTSVLKNLSSVQIVHLYFLSSLWVASCLFKWIFWANLLSQVEHTNNFSPVWTLVWTSRWHLVGKTLKQMLHLFGLDSSCFALWCLLRQYLFENVFLKIRQLNCFPIFLCGISQSKKDNYLKNISELN